MASQRATFDFSGLARQAARLGELSEPKIAAVRQRTLSTLARRLPVEASRLAAEQIINLPRSLVRKGLSGKVAGPKSERYAVLRGSSTRIALSLFGGARYAGRKAPGAVAAPYRNEPLRTYKSSFTIKGRGIRGGIWTRPPKHATNKGGPTSARYPRLIIQRKGPSISRAIMERKHGDIIPALTEFGGRILRAEVERLLKVKG